MSLSSTSTSSPSSEIVDGDIASKREGDEENSNDNNRRNDIPQTSTLNDLSLASTLKDLSEAPTLKDLSDASMVNDLKGLSHASTLKDLSEVSALKDLSRALTLKDLCQVSRIKNLSQVYTNRDSGIQVNHRLSYQQDAAELRDVSDVDIDPERIQTSLGRDSNEGQQCHPKTENKLGDGVDPLLGSTVSGDENDGTSSVNAGCTDGANGTLRSPATEEEKRSHIRFILDNPKMSGRGTAVNLKHCGKSTVQQLKKAIAAGDASGFNGSYRAAWRAVCNEPKYREKVSRQPEVSGTESEHELTNEGSVAVTTAAKVKVDDSEEKSDIKLRSRKLEGAKVGAGPAQKKPRRDARVAEAYDDMEAAHAEDEASEKGLHEAERLLEQATKDYKAAVARRAAAAKKLTQSKCSVVDAELRLPEDEWNQMYHRLVAYKEEYGNILFPLDCRHYDDEDLSLRALGRWVGRQRKSRPKMKWTRREALDRIDFIWDTYEATWTARYNELIAFKAETGHCNVPASYDVNPQLSTWVQTQRKQYKYMQDGKKSHLTVERVKLLEDAGFTWEVNKWQDRYEELLAYRQRHGDIDVRKEDYPQLREWIATQRTHYRFRLEGKNSQLTDERVRLLESIGFQWKTRGTWMSRYEEFVKYVSAHGGDCHVPRTYCPTLAKWATRQRHEYNSLLEGRTSCLTPDQVRLLTNLGHAWTLFCNSSQSR